MIFLKRIISFILIISILFLVSPFAFAEDYQSTPKGFWESILIKLSQLSSDSIIDDIPLLSTIIRYSTDVGSDLPGGITYHSGNICALSPDSYHHADSLIGCHHGEDSYGTYISATCKYCNEHFKYYSDDLSLCYDSYVDAIEDDLGTTTVTSSGNFLLPVPLSYVRDRDIHYDYCNYNYFIIPPTLLNGSRNYVYIDGDVIAPINGYYTPIINLSHSSNISFSVAGFTKNQRYPFAEGSIIANGFCLMSSFYPNDFIWAKGDIWFLVEPYVPIESLTQVDISPSTRIGYIPGNIGYLDTSTNTYIVTGGRLINEDNRTIYNPITDTTTTYEDYTYNYDNRSYTFDTGDTITYGDEHITYITNEGDTYNYYYIVEQSGSGDNGGSSGSSGSGSGSSGNPFGRILDAVANAVGTLIEAIASWVSSLIGALVDIAADAASALAGLVGSLIDYIAELIASAGNALSGIGELGLTDFYGTVQEIITAVPTEILTIFFAGLALSIVLLVISRLK